MFLPGIFVVKAQSDFIDSVGVGHDHVEAVLQTKKTDLYKKTLILCGQIKHFSFIICSPDSS